jgi:hypothetical protein
MKSIAWSLTVLGALSLIAACGDDSGDADEGGADGGEEEHLPMVDCEDGEDIPGFADVAAFEKCAGCHSSDLSGAERNGAPSDDNWDDYEQAMEHAEEIAHEVYEGEMPPEGSGVTLTADEKSELYRWALCGAPE